MALLRTLVQATVENSTTSKQLAIILYGTNMLDEYILLDKVQS